MKALKSQIKCITIAVLLLFQSCATYYKNSFPQALEKVSNKDKAVEILTIKGEKMKYKKIIIYNNNSYYGITKNNLSNDTIPINITTIKELKLKNRTVLNILEYIGIAALLGVVLVVWVDSGFDFKYDD
jgi:hypothetical protein